MNFLTNPSGPLYKEVDSSDSLLKDTIKSAGYSESPRNFINRLNNWNKIQEELIKEITDIQPI